MTGPDAARQKKVLVIDDDLGILEALKFMLESTGYSVETVSRGDMVDSAVRAFCPDIILLDLYLSGHDGRDIAVMLKRQKDLERIPIVMISAHPSAGSTLTQVPVSDFLPKPFEVSQLLTIIEKHTA